MSGNMITSRLPRTIKTNSAVQWKRRLMMAFASIVIQLVKTSWAQTTEPLEDLKSTSAAAEAGNKSMSKSSKERDYW